MPGAALHGGCACGAVRFSAVPVSDTADVCHCGMCRRWTGGMSISSVVTELAFAADAPIGVWHSSAWAERLFCTRCGSSLAYRTLDGAYTSVQAAAFDAPFAPTVASEYFVDEKPAGYDLTQATRKMTGAEVFAQYGATDPAAADGEARAT